MERFHHLVFTADIGKIVFCKVPNVGDVRHVRNVPAKGLGSPENEVSGDKGPEIPNVSVRINGRSAGVKTKARWVDCIDRFFLAG